MWETILFCSFGGLAVLLGLLVILFKNPVDSAVALIGNLFCVAALFALLDAHFLAVIQVLLYAGAILVLFLFVIMLLGAEKLDLKDPLKWQRPLALVLGIILVAESIYMLIFKAGQFVPETVLPDGFGSPESIGTELFQGYLLPFEVTSVLLLVAMIGAIVLTRQVKNK